MKRGMTMNDRIKYWTNKVPTEDPLSDDKKYAVIVAIELCYVDTVLERILNAETTREIDRALKVERTA